MNLDHEKAQVILPQQEFVANAVPKEKQSAVENAK